MDFSLSEEQNMLKQSFIDFLSRECSFEKVKEIKTSPKGYSKRIWKKIAQLGWMGLVYEEKYGGIERPFLELFILFEAIGSALLPSPLFASTVMSGLLLSEAGNEQQKEKYLFRIIDGENIFTVAWVDKIPWALSNHAETIAVKKSSGGYIVNGSFPLVPYVDVADYILFPVNIRDETTNGQTIFIVKSDSPGISYSAMDTITDEKQFSIRLENVGIPLENIIGKIGHGDLYLKQMIEKAVTIKCAEMIGAFKKVLDMTVAYAAERKQFGVPIGKFQVIQHYCADMAIHLHGAQLIAYQAASMLSKGKECTKEVAMAKAWCSDTYSKATKMCHQIHGSVGFTDELHIGLFYKHAKASELMFGHSKIHRTKVIQDMLPL